MCDLQAWAVEDHTLELCQPYEFHGQLSSELDESPRLSTHDESGLSIDLVVKPQGETSLDLIALRGKPVTARAWVRKKISIRQYEAKIYRIELDSPQGIGAGTGNKKAKKLNEKPTESCSE